MDTDLGKKYTFMTHDLLDIAIYPHLKRFHLPGLIDTPNEFKIMYLLSQAGEFCEQRNLHLVLGLSAPCVSMLVCNLIEKGLIRRKMNPDDGRSSLITLTKKGKTVKSWVLECIEEYNKILLKGFSADEIKKYNDMTVRMAENLLDISEREISHMPEYHPSQVKDMDDVPPFISLDNQKILISMAKKVERLESKN